MEIIVFSFSFFLQRKKLLCNRYIKISSTNDPFFFTFTELWLRGWLTYTGCERSAWPRGSHGPHGTIMFLFVRRSDHLQAVWHLISHQEFCAWKWGRKYRLWHGASNKNTIGLLAKCWLAWCVCQPVECSNQDFPNVLVFIVFSCYCPDFLES